MFFKKITGICLATFCLAACAGGMHAGVMNGNGDDPMERIKITKSDYNPITGQKPITFQQYNAVMELAERIGIMIAWQTSSNFDACASEGLPYTAAGALGGASQGLLYPGAMTGAAAGVSGITYGLGGCVNGVITHSYDGDYAEGDPLEKAMRDQEDDMADPAFYVTNERGQKISLFHNLHVTASFVNSLNRRGQPAPELARHMPDFTGAPIGSAEH